MTRIHYIDIVCVSVRAVSSWSNSDASLGDLVELGCPELTFDGHVGFFGPPGVSPALRGLTAADLLVAVMQSDFGEKLSVI